METALQFMRESVEALEPLRAELRESDAADTLLENEETFNLYSRYADLMRLNGQQDAMRAFLERTGLAPADGGAAFDGRGVNGVAMKPTLARKHSKTVPKFPAWRPSRRLALKLTLAALLGSISGCGGGGNSFTGGSIPIGKAALTGRVVHSDDATQPLANAPVEIVASPQNSAVKILHATTDQNGVFNVTDIPTDAASGPVTVTAASADGAYKAQQISFRLTNNHSASVIFALPPANYTPAIGTTLTISPSRLTAQPGQRIQVSARLQSPGGAPLALTPTLFFDDSFGLLNPDGTFTASDAGTGAITAYWYNGLSATASVTVSQMQIAIPPAPP